MTKQFSKAEQNEFYQQFAVIRVCPSIRADTKSVAIVVSGSAAVTCLLFLFQMRIILISGANNCFTFKSVELNT
jgi:hypothetical protein